MAVAELIVSRRALLGAACAVPLARAAEGPPLPRHPGLACPEGAQGSGSTFASPPPRQGRWIPDRVRNDEGAGQQETRSFAVTKWDRALARFRRAEAALAAAAHEPDEEVYGDLVVAFNRALERLLAAPAPTLAALAAKLDLAVRHAAWELIRGDASMAALVRDALRLARSAG